MKEDFFNWECQQYPRDKLTWRWGSSMLCQVVSLLFYVIAFSSYHWLGGSVGEMRLQVGMWTACLDNKCASVFEDNDKILNELGGWLHIVQAFAVLGLLLMSFHLLLSLVFWATRENRLSCDSFILLSSAIILVAAIFTSFSTFLYGFKATKKYIKPDSEIALEYSFHLGWFSSVMSCVAALFYGLEYRRHQNHKGEYTRLN